MQIPSDYDSQILLRMQKKKEIGISKCSSLATKLRSNATSLRKTSLNFRKDTSLKISPMCLLWGPFYMSYKMASIVSN